MTFLRKRVTPTWAASILLAIPIVAAAQALADDPAAARRSEAPPVTTTVSAALSLPRDRLVALEYVESPNLTALLERELSARGVPIGPLTAGTPVTAVRVRGVLQLTGKRTARIRIAELAEKGTLVEIGDGARAHAPADVAFVIAAGDWLGRLVERGQISAPAGAFLLLDMVGQATGVKDWFNTTVGGDRRGVCLINCDQWHVTRQAAFHIVEIQDGSAIQRAEVRSELRAEALEPGRVVSAGLAAVVDALTRSDALPNLSDRNHAATSD